MSKEGLTGGFILLSLKDAGEDAGGAHLIKSRWDSLSRGPPFPPLHPMGT